MPQTALITGASAGIGTALAKVFAQHDYDVILVARRKDRLEELATQLRNQYAIRTHVFSADLTQPEAAQKLYDEVKQQNLSVNVLVNNAGIGSVGAFMETDLTVDIQMMQLNMLALTSLTKLFAQDMVAAQNGHILNVASIASFMPGPMMTVYHATKAFVLYFSEGLKEELKESGVNVTVSCPGPTESEFHQTSGSEKISLFDKVPLMSSEQVAENAFQAMLQGKTIAVPGTLNKLATLVPHLPRGLVPPLLKRVIKTQ